MRQVYEKSDDSELKIQVFEKGEDLKVKFLG